ncbi:MAG: iron-containing alcohol dehydrogenase [Clostridia bacterium]|nr:iron-containing alcohol dehydrogenase [Clostridia bacterium]
MDNFVFCTPTKFYFGKDTHLQAGEILKKAGAKKILLYYGSGSIFSTGLYGQVTGSLRDARVDYVELGGVKANPDLAFCRKTVEFIRENGVNFILAVGGGSVIDSAKLAAIAVGTGADPWAIVKREVQAEKALPLGVILTISATGSEGSESAVLTNEELGRKLGFSSPLNRPCFAILNPELTYTLPPYQTAAGITDIMMHTAERYISLSGENALLDGMAEALLRSVIAAGRKALQDPRDYEARATLMWAGTLSHNGLMSTGRKYFMGAHRLQQEMSAMDTTVTHGAGLAVIWPAYMKYLYRYDLARFSQYAVRIWGCEMDFYHPERTAQAGIERTETYFRSIGMPTRLGEMGFTEKQIPTLAANCTEDGKIVLPCIIPLDQAKIEEIYRLAL